MKISIITVCFNSEKTIEQTIKSVLSQDIEDLEYIIVDGQSSDKTLEIINKYKENISVLISESDSGIYNAMNKGIAISTGEVIGIINSDDWYEAGAVKAVIDCFSKPETKIVYGNMNMVDGEEILGKWPVNELKEIRYRMVLPHPTVFIRKEVYNQYKMFDENYELAADYELLLRLYNKGIKFTYLDKMIANFRINGASAKRAQKCAEEAYEIAYKYLKYVDVNQKDYWTEKIESNYKANLFMAVVKQNIKFIINKIRQARKGTFEVAIFGSGRWGIKMCNLLIKNELVPSCFIDSDSGKWNKTKCDIKIMSPEVLKDFNGVVLIMVKDYSEEISKKINEMKNSQLVCIRWEELMSDIFCE